MNVEFRASFANDLKGIQSKPLLQKVKETIEQVEQASTLREISNLKHLKGGGSYYRIRVGDYRIGLLVKNEMVAFVRILHRKDIYRYFP